MFILFFSLVLSGHVFASEFIPEASGATKVGGTIIIAGDEEPKALWLLEGNELKKESVKAKWDDMESLATVDEKLFFACTSHGLTKKGKRKPEREQLFLMEKTEKIAVQKTWSLRNEILKYLEANFGSDLNMETVSTASPDHGGLNIEGLAYVDGKLFVGLRSPVTSKGEAIVLVFTSPLTSPKLTSNMRIDLGGKGIRSLENSNGALLILSGSPNDEQETFGLSKLDLTTQRVSRFLLAGFEALIRPEGVVADGAGFTLVQDFEAPESQEVIQYLE